MKMEPRLHPFNKNDADKILMGVEHLMRCQIIPGFREKFKAEFTKRAGQSSDGTVNVTVLTRDILVEMKVEDPIK